MQKCQRKSLAGKGPKEQRTCARTVFALIAGAAVTGSGHGDTRNSFSGRNIPHKAIIRGDHPLSTGGVQREDEQRVGYQWLKTSRLTLAGFQGRRLHMQVTKARVNI